MSRRSSRTKGRNVRRSRLRDNEIHLDVMRSTALLIEGNPELSREAASLLASMVADTFGFADDPDELVSILRGMHDKGLIGIENGEAFLGRPERDPFGRVRCVRDDSALKQVDTPFGDLSSSGAYHADDCTLIPTRWMEDRRLSPSARGMLLTLASHRDDDLPAEADLVGASSAEEVASYLAELDRVGYLVRHEDGRLGVRDAGGAR